MTRNELVAVVDLVRAAWNKDSWKEDESRTVRAWWRYLQDLEYRDVVSTVDRFVTRGDTFPPTVGAIRRATIDRVRPADRPDQNEAWKQVSERMRAVETGLEWPAIHPTVAEALRHAGFDGRGRVDEKVFRASWETVTGQDDESRYEVSDPVPFKEAE